MGKALATRSFRSFVNKVSTIWPPVSQIGNLLIKSPVRESKAGADGPDALRLIMSGDLLRSVDELMPEVKQVALQWFSGVQLIQINTGEPSMSSGKFVAVGLLTRRDLDVLGSGFRRAYPLSDIKDFAALLTRIDEADRMPRKLAAAF